MSSNTQAQAAPGKIWTRDFVLVCLGNCFIFVGLQMTLPTRPLFVKELGGGDQLIGIIIGVFPSSRVVVRTYAGKALEAKGRQLVYMVGLVIFVISVGSYAFIISIGLLVIMRIVQGIGWG